MQVKVADYTKNSLKNRISKFISSAKSVERAWIPTKFFVSIWPAVQELWPKRAIARYDKIHWKLYCAYYAIWICCDLPTQTTLCNWSRDASSVMLSSLKIDFTSQAGVTSQTLLLILPELTADEMQPGWLGSDSPASEQWVSAMSRLICECALVFKIRRLSLPMQSYLSEHAKEGR